MKPKIRLGILFGGQSSEHEISLRSAANIIAALDPEKYELTLMGIDKQGRWYFQEESARLFSSSQANKKLPSFDGDGHSMVLLSPGEGGGPRLPASQGDVRRPATDLSQLDVIFPAIHGPLAEDGTVQGLIQLMNIACVGSGVLGSAIAMDKAVTKSLLREAGLPIGKYRVFHSFQQSQISFDELSRDLGLPLFVKPANQGSSVGVHKVTDKSSFETALQDAFLYDHKILVEEAIDGREIELGVLGNDELRVTVPGEILVYDQFYSYKAKYVDDAGCALAIPAELPKDVILSLQETAKQVFRILNCRGMARVDFFVTKDGKIYVNELNSIPGFTKKSMYPLLWEASGISYSQLIDELVELALQQHGSDKNLSRSYQ